LRPEKGMREEKHSKTQKNNKKGFFLIPAWRRRPFGTDNHRVGAGFWRLGRNTTGVLHDTERVERIFRERRKKREEK